MAKRRYVQRAATAVRRVYRRARGATRRYVRRAGMSGASWLSVGISVGYGWLRGWAGQNGYIQKIASWLPFGGAYKDNIVLGGLALVGSWLTRGLKGTLGTMARMLCNVALHDEAFLIGGKLQRGYSLTDNSTTSISTAQTALNG